MNPFKDLTLRQCLYLGVCAVLLTALRTALRLKLGIPGHTMLPTIFFLALGRGLVPKKGAATVVAILAGLLLVMFGAHKSGFRLFFQLCLSGVILDFAATLPGVLSSWLPAFFAGAVAACARTVFYVVGAFLAGMDPVTIAISAGTMTAGNMLFGGVGAALVPATLRRLKRLDVAAESTGNQ